MTVCNMTIEGGGRAGHDRARRDDVRVGRGPPGRARRDFDAAVERWRELHTDDGATLRHARSTVDAAALSPAWSPGARTPGMVVAGHRAPCPSRVRRADERALDYMDLRARHADRRRSRSTACSSARARTRASATCAPPPRSSRAARSPPTSTRWSSPARQQVKAQAEAEGLDEVFRAAGFDWRGAGCSMCLGMNPDILAARRALRLDLEPQLRGPPGPRRAHAPRLARRWPPRPRSRATSSTSGSWS